MLASELLFHVTTCLSIGVENGVERSARGTNERFQRAPDAACDVPKTNPAVQIECHGLFVRRVEHRGRGTARPTRLDTETERGELVMPHGLERQWRPRDRVKGWYPSVANTVRVGERVQNGQLHAWRTELSHHAAVDELDERMHDALRMHDDVDALVRNAEEIVGLDHLQGLVGKRGAVHGDLRSHLPCGMPQRLLRCRIRDAVGTPVTKWTARRRQHDPADLPHGTRADRLKNRPVLAIDRYDLGATACRSSGYQ